MTTKKKRAAKRPPKKLAKPSRPAPPPKVGRGHGKPPDPAVIRRALDLARRTSPEEASEVLRRESPKGPSSRTIREWQKGRNGAAAAMAAAHPAEAKPETPPAPPAPVVVEEPPAHLTAQQRRLWYVERQIGTVRQALASAEQTNNLPRIGPLNEQLRAWLKMHADLQPAPTVDPDAERRRWEQDAASVIAKIRAGITAERARAGAPA